MRQLSGTNRTHYPRRGSSLIEMIVSTVLLTAVLVCAAPLISWSMQQRGLAEKQQLANQEVANLLETVATTSWDQLTQQNVSQWKLNDATEAELNQAKLEVSIKQSDAAPIAKQVVVKLTWSDKMNRPVAPIRLSTWVYQAAGATP